MKTLLTSLSPALLLVFAVQVHAQGSADNMLNRAESERLRLLAKPVPGTADDLQEYERRHQEKAVEDSRKLKDAMRRVVDTIPSTGGDRKKKKDEGYTGISDGTWSTSHVERIRRQYAPPEEKKGILERMGSTLKHDDSKYIEKRRAGMVSDEFAPFERISNIGKPDPRERSIDYGYEEESGYEEEEKDGKGLLGGLGSKAAGLIPGRGERDEEMYPEEVPLDQRYAPENQERLMPNEDTARMMVQPQDEPESAPVPEQDNSGGFASKLPGLPRPGSRQSATSPSGGIAIESSGNSTKIRSVGGGVRQPAPDEPYAADPSFHIVTNKAPGEFFEYNGDSRSEAEPWEVPPGTLVQVTKPGEEWSGVNLPNGRNGIIRTKALRRARASEAPSSYQPQQAESAPPSEVPASSSPPESAPAPSMPVLPSNSGSRDQLGSGLLPPISQ